MDDQTNRGRDEEARDPDREGGLGSRRDEAPGQNKPEEEAPAEEPMEGEETPAEPAPPEPAESESAT